MHVPLTDARAKLFELTRAAEVAPVTLMRHGRPAAVLVSAAGFDTLLERLEDLEDRLSVYEARESPTDLNVPLEKLGVELGLEPRRSAGKPRARPRRLG